MKRVALLLSDEHNSYQQLLVRQAQAAAGGDIALLTPQFASGLAMNQISQVFAAVRATPPVDAIMIMLASAGEGLEKTLAKAAHDGIACVFLNRTPASLEQIRASSPGAMVGCVKPDQRRIGAIQAEQCLALSSEGGFVLLVLGARGTLSAIERRDGFLGAIGRRREIHEIESDWTKPGGENTLRDWYRVGADRRRTVSAVVCQNDPMAEGVHAVLAARGPEALSIPVIGCDGLPEQGQTLVKNGIIAATVVMPPTTPPALQMLRDHWAGRGVRDDVVLEPISYPPLAELRREGAAS